MRPRAADLRHRVTIRKPLRAAADVEGNRALRFVDNRTVAASVEPLTSREAENAKTFAATISHKVTIRYTRDLLPTYQLGFKGRTFSIDAPPLNPDEANEYLILFCSERV